ncbi:Hypothetical predicted protein [Lecanosticta acicola]|uniref:Mucin-7 n=1 Tax=Lecanosticta acicola TaxID=111012 RepID=A0AAI9EET4_9PEZI|nr:Hypothetical predicted protein [Lecanosticta acicola]
MSSEPRPNSAVRNLRSIFENRASENSPSARGRSPAGLGDLDTDRPTSKVRASFIPVEPAKMSSQPAERPDSEVKRESNAGLRRSSMSEGHSGDAYNVIKELVNTEQDRRDNESSVADTIPEMAVESAGPTPAREVNNTLTDAATGGVQAPVGTESKEAENPDKHVTGAEEEPAELKPADPVSESAVSGGDALPPVAEDLRKTTTAAKPASISTKTAKPASAIKSPTNPVKSRLSPAPSKAPSQRVPTKKPSRTSLTAPTAASVARAAVANDKGASATAGATKPKPRDVTKPADISSRLTAPTAASRARLESNSASSSNAKPTPSSTATSRPKPSASARPTPRSSLAGRPESRGSQAPKKSAPVDGSFLERMTRPTAASANKTHEKPEVKSPPRKQIPLRPKTNGQPKAKATNDNAHTVEAVPEQESSVVTQHESKDTTVEPVEPVEQVSGAASADAGNETPLAHINGQKDPATLETTPAAVSGENAIR